MKRFFSLIISAALIIAPGCVKADEKENEIKPEEVKEVVTVEGGTLKATVRKPDTYNPIVTVYESCREVFYLFYDGLYTISDSMAAVENLAESYTPSEDNTGGTLKLKTGITFSDGSLFTADDVLYTVSFIKEHPENYGGCTKNIESVSKISDSEVYIKLYEPERHFETMLTFPVIKNGSPEYMSCPVGTGQFVCAESDIGYTGLECRRNSGYHLGRAYIEGFSLSFTNTDLKAKAAFSSGESDVLINSDPEAAENKKDTVTVYKGKTNRFEFLGFNSASGIFTFEEARRAVYEAVGKMKLSDGAEKINKTSLIPINPDAWFLEPEPAYEGEDPKEILSRNSWQIGSAGVYEKNGQPFEFKILVNEEDSERLALAKFLSGALIEYGISCDVKALSYEQYASAVASGDFDAFIGGTAIGNASNPGFLFKTGGSANVFGYSGGVMDLRIASLATADDVNIASEAKKFSKAFSECAPAAGLYFKTMYVSAKKGVVIPAISPTGVYVTAYTWYMTK